MERKLKQIKGVWFENVTGTCQECAFMGPTGDITEALCIVPIRKIGELMEGVICELKTMWREIGEK